MTSSLRTTNFTFDPLALQGLVQVTPHRRPDPRGWLCEVHNAAEFAEAGLRTGFVQENQSFTRAAGVMRGLHIQARPAAKLVRVAAGRVFSVGVDMRPSSPDFGRWAGLELSAESGAQMFLPAGFAHGVCVLEPATVLAWSLDRLYDPAGERGVRWNDPDLAIAWPWSADRMVVSPKDATLPCWREVSVADWLAGSERA